MELCLLLGLVALVILILLRANRQKRLANRERLRRGLKTAAEIETIRFERKYGL